MRGRVWWLAGGGWTLGAERALRQLLNPGSGLWFVGIYPVFFALAWVGIKWPRWIGLSWPVIALLVYWFGPLNGYVGMKE